VPEINGRIVDVFSIVIRFRIQIDARTSRRSSTLYL